MKMFNFQFRLVLFFAILLLINSCISNELNLTHKYSKTQQDLFHLVDNYKLEYNAAKSSVDKDLVQNKYLLAFKNLLDDSLGNRIDSMIVTVDTIIEKDWLLTTQFHSKEIEFKYSMKFNDSMDSANSALYNSIKNLKSENEVLLNFIKLGGIELNKPDEITGKIVRIFAFPYTPAFVKSRLQ